MYHFLVCVISKHYDLHSEVSVLKLYWLLAKGIINGNIRQSKILYVCVHKDMCVNTAKHILISTLITFYGNQ